jgi:hypothetical protein
MNLRKNITNSYLRKIMANNIYQLDVAKLLFVLAPDVVNYIQDEFE